VSEQQENCSETPFLYNLEERVIYEHPQDTYNKVIVKDRTSKRFAGGKEVMRYFVINNQIADWVYEKELASLHDLALDLEKEEWNNKETQ
jgi:hypothetical protein